MISTPFCEHDWKHEARCWYANHPKVMSRLMHQSTLIPASLCTLKASSKASVQAAIFTSLHLCWALEIWVDWGLEASTRFSCRRESRSFCITCKHFQSASNLTCNLDKQHIANWFLHFFATQACFPCWTSSSSLCRASSSSSALKMCETSSTFELVFYDVESWRHFADLSKTAPESWQQGGLQILEHQL